MAVAPTTWIHACNAGFYRVGRRSVFENGKRVYLRRDVSNVSLSGGFSGYNPDFNNGLLASSHSSSTLSMTGNLRDHV